ncbi:hypothetical protein Tco_0316244 [Tanacetum coccineum]
MLLDNFELFYFKSYAYTETEICKTLKVCEKSDTSLCGCQKPDHLATRLGCAETKVATWDDLAFKLIILGWNVRILQKSQKNGQNWTNTDKETNKECTRAGSLLSKVKKSTHGQPWVLLQLGMKETPRREMDFYTKVPVGKSNYYLDVEKSQNNPIYKITVDILKHTSFFRAFIDSSTIPSIYIQQFWDTVRYDKTTGSYSCKLDEQWLDLTKDTLRDALQITPVDNNNAFSSPPTPDVLIKFVNDLGYPKAVRTLSDVMTNDMFQPWRALTTIINLCLTRKTSGFERPRAPGRKKANLIVIPSVRFTKLIIHHLQSKHKFYPRPGSPLHLPNEESVLGYLKFSAKGTKQEVFGMPIPNNLITADIQGEQYYNAYLEKVTKHQRYLAGEEVSDPDSPAPKPAKATKPKATKQSKSLAPKAAPVTKPAAAEAPKPTAS